LQVREFILLQFVIANVLIRRRIVGGFERELTVSPFLEWVSDVGAAVLTTEHEDICPVSSMSTLSAVPILPRSPQKIHTRSRVRAAGRTQPLLSLPSTANDAVSTTPNATWKTVVAAVSNGLFDGVNL